MGFINYWLLLDNPLPQGTFVIGAYPLLYSVLLIGVYANLLHLLGLLNCIKIYLILPTFLVLIVALIRINLFGQLASIKTWKKPEKILLALIIIQFLTYSLGIFVPETAFDALWYHLPQAQVYVATAGIRPIPELLYSTMPRLADMLFIPGFLLDSMFIIKLTIFLITILFIRLSYHFARLCLPRFWSLLATAAVNGTFIIAWQSTSGYVDIPRALFELAGLFLLTQLITKQTPIVISSSLSRVYRGKKFLFNRIYSKIKRSLHFSRDDTKMIKTRLRGHVIPLPYFPSPFVAKDSLPKQTGVRGSLPTQNTIILAGIFMGFALSVKIQALTTLLASIIFIIMASIQNKQLLRQIILTTSFYLLATVITASPWHLYNWHHSGHPFYPTNLPAKQLDQLTHAGAGSLSDWLVHQTLTLPLIFWDLSFNYSRLITPIILLLLPLAWLTRHQLVKRFLPLLLASYFMLLSWWFTPPPENRYLLGLAPVLITLLLYSVHKLSNKHYHIKQIAFISTLIIIFINLAVRFAVTYQNLPVIIGLQSRQDYIDSHTTDFNRSIMDKFYSGHWQRYQYP